MAYKSELRDKARNFYASGLSIDLISKKLSIPKSTIQRWKRKEKGTPLDWDHLRYISTLSDQSIESLNQTILAKFLDMLDSTIQEVYESEISAQEKTKLLASLGDTFNKMISAMKKTTPEVAVADVALRVLEIVLSVVKEDEELTERFTPYLDQIKERIIREFSK